MRNDNRIQVPVDSSFSSGRRLDRMDLHGELDIHVETNLGPSGIAGVVMLALGALALLIGAAFFLNGFPDTWYGAGDITFEESKRLVERVMISSGLGVILLFAGTSLYFYGRTTRGAGSLDQYRLDDNLKVEGGNDHA